jgi:hypothetical protein
MGDDARGKDKQKGKDAEQRNKTTDPFDSAFLKVQAQYDPAKKTAAAELRALNDELQRLLDTEPIARRTAQLKDAIGRFARIEQTILGCMMPPGSTHSTDK